MMGVNKGILIKKKKREQIYNRIIMNIYTKNMSLLLILKEKICDEICDEKNHCNFFVFKSVMVRVWFIYVIKQINFVMIHMILTCDIRSAWLSQDLIT
jgi:hypothetical protein